MLHLAANVLCDNYLISRFAFPFYLFARRAIFQYLKAISHNINEMYFRHQFMNYFSLNFRNVEISDRNILSNSQESIYYLNQIIFHKAEHKAHQ